MNDMADDRTPPTRSLDELTGDAAFEHDFLPAKIPGAPPVVVDCPLPPSGERGPSLVLSPTCTPGSYTGLGADRKRR